MKHNPNDLRGLILLLDDIAERDATASLSRLNIDPVAYGLAAADLVYQWRDRVRALIRAEGGRRSFP